MGLVGGSDSVTSYSRPIAPGVPARPQNGHILPGVWICFDKVQVLTRTGPSRIIAASDVPAAILTRLTAPRTDICGLSTTAPQIMGILNVTPDSFSDGGQHDDVVTATDRAQQMVDDGATIIDIGGESTRPGADFVPVDVEIARIRAPIIALKDKSEVAISIDTRKAEVADAAMQAGANLINDVAAFTYDPDMSRVAAQHNAPVCLMHAQGDPKTMQDEPSYENVLLDVYDFLEDKVALAERAGIEREKIIVDPGIGFGKTLQHNLQLLRGLSLFHGLGCPILLGASRKKFIGTIGKAPDASDRLAGSVSVALFGIAQGVQILRVHDTFATKQAIDLQMAMIEARADGT